jgi:hypothetical protein
MRYALTLLVLLASGACHPGQPVIGGDKLQVGGTISGTVSATGGSTALASRKVTAVDTATNKRYETTTAANGGYTIKVPKGTYRIELELRGGETLAKQPGESHINNGDLDARRDFIVTASAR